MSTINNPEGLSARIIYNYDKKLNQTWNISQYRTPRQYLDPLKQVKDREMLTQKKGEKDRKYITKRGFYMDYDLKIASSVPGSNKHGSNQPWSVQKMLKIAKHKKVDKSLMKRTYLQQIQTEQKNRKMPGICTYSIEKSQKQKDAFIEQMKKRKSFVAQKHYYHNDTEYLADKSPGSGAYNPHDSIQKIKPNKTTYKDWVIKHQLLSQKSLKVKKSIPAPGTYDPMNHTFTTFDLIQKDKSKSKQKGNGFGTDARFEYTRNNKKAIVQKRPDPISYNTAYEWRNKTSSKSKPWNEAVCKPYATLSVYH